MRDLHDLAIRQLAPAPPPADQEPPAQLVPDLEAIESNTSDNDRELPATPRPRFGLLTPLLDDPAIEEIWINGPDDVYVARRGENLPIELAISSRQIEELVERMLSSSGRRVDRSSPFVDARLSDGSRLHVAIPPIVGSWCINIRKFVGIKEHELAELVESGSLSASCANFLAASVEVGLNIVVAGAVGAGKTTLLNCLAGSIPPHERVVTCEEVLELKIGLGDVVGMQCREPNLEGEGEVSLRRLVKETLRMRPDRIIVGEVRGAEALDMLLAMNAGCAAMTSVHANSAKDALRKLVTLPLLAGENVARDFVEPTVAACVDLIVFCSRDSASGVRVVQEVLGVAEQIAAGGISASAIFRRSDSGLEWTGEYPRARNRFAARKIDLVDLLAGSETR